MPLLTDLASAPLVSGAGADGNHAHWILGHLVHSEGQFRAMLQETPNPAGDLKEHFGRGTKPDPQGRNYPAYGALLSRLTNMRAETRAWLESVSEADLDRPLKQVAPGFELFFGTARQCVLMMSLHGMNHRGQLADCRHAAGRPPLMI